MQIDIKEISKAVEILNKREVRLSKKKIKHKLTLATLRVIKAGGKGHRKSQETPDYLSEEKKQKKLKNKKGGIK